MKKRAPSRKSLSPSRKGPIKAGRGTVTLSHGHGKPRFPVKRTRDRFGSAPLPKRTAKLIKKARKYSGAKKASYSKRINKRFYEELVRSKRYTPQEIEDAQQYRVTAKVRRLASLKYFKEGNKYRIGGRFVSKDKYMRSIRMRQYHAVVKSYREKFGLSAKEARQLYRDLRDERYGDTAFGALY
jgi:hypothetical protein